MIQSKHSSAWTSTEKAFTLRLGSQPAAGVEMKRFLVPVLLTGLLLILAVTISFILTGQLGTQITCGDFNRVRGGCTTNWGQSLSFLWGIVAGSIGLIWVHFRNR
jgi:hypothetical protein